MFWDQDQSRELQHWRREREQHDILHPDVSSLALLPLLKSICLLTRQTSVSVILKCVSSPSCASRHTDTHTHTLPLLLDSSLAMTQVAHGKHQASQSCSTGSSVSAVCLPLPVTSALAACCTLYKKMRISLESCNQPRFCYPWFVFAFFTLRSTHTYLHQLLSWIYFFPACCYDASFSCVMRKQARVYNAHHHNNNSSC